MLGTFAVGVLDLGIVHVGMGDARLEVVEHHTVGDAAKELEAVAVEQQPGLDGLIPDKLDVHKATPGQDHDEGPRLAERPSGRIDHAASVAKIDLGLLAGRGLDADGHVGLGGRELRKKAIHGREGAGKAALTEAFADGDAFDAGGMQLQNQRPERLDAGDGLGRRGGQERLLGQRGQLLDGRQVAGKQTVLGRPSPVAADSPAVEAGGALDRAVVGGGAQLAHQVSQFHILNPRARHRTSRATECCATGL